MAWSREVDVRGPQGPAGDPLSSAALEAARVAAEAEVAEQFVSQGAVTERRVVSRIPLYADQVDGLGVRGEVGMSPFGWDGQMRVSRWSRKRIIEDVAPPVVDAPWTPGCAFRPLHPDRSRHVGLGSSTWEHMAPYAADLFGSAGIAYTNLAKAGEDAVQGNVRFGATPLLVAFPADTIPASTDTITVETDVPIAAASVNGAALLPFEVTVGGVAGTISTTTNGAQVRWTRKAAGAAVALGGPRLAIPTDGERARDAVATLNLGKNTLNGSPGAEIITIEAYRDAVAWLVPLSTRFCVVGHFVNRDATAEQRRQVLAVNAWLRTAYGPVYIDMQEWMCSAVAWTQTGITPTQADLDAQAAGYKPPSLSLDNAHLTPVAEKAWFDNVYTPAVTALGFLEAS